MPTSDSDLQFGSQIVRRLLKPGAQPPQLAKIYRSLDRLHAELGAHGMTLNAKTPYGPEAGFMLLYRKDNVVVRIKTRGERPSSKFRAGQAHLSVILVSGERSDVDLAGLQTSRGAMLTGWDNEIGKFGCHGGLVNKAPRGPYYGQDGPQNKALLEDWADETHFVFPDSDVDDSMVSRLFPLYSDRL